MPNCKGKKLKTKLRTNQFYCVKCCTRITPKENDICVKKYKNDRSRDGYIPALKSYCSKCDTPLTKWIKYDDFNHLVDKYGTC